MSGARICRGRDQVFPDPGRTFDGVEALKKVQRQTLLFGDRALHLRIHRDSLQLRARFGGGVLSLYMYTVGDKILWCAEYSNGSNLLGSQMGPKPRVAVTKLYREMHATFLQYAGALDFEVEP